MKFTVGAGIKFGLGLAIGKSIFNILNEVGGTLYYEARRIWNEENEENDGSTVEEAASDDHNAVSED